MTLTLSFFPLQREKKKFVFIYSTALPASAALLHTLSRSLRESPGTASSHRSWQKRQRSERERERENERETLDNSHLSVVVVVIMSSSARLPVVPTVTVLAVMKSRLAGAIKGHSLLKKKADALTIR